MKYLQFFAINVTPFTPYHLSKKLISRDLFNDIHIMPALSLHLIAAMTVFAFSNEFFNQGKADNLTFADSWPTE